MPNIEDLNKANKRINELEAEVKNLNASINALVRKVEWYEKKLSKK